MKQLKTMDLSIFRHCPLQWRLSSPSPKSLVFESLQLWSSALHSTLTEDKDEQIEAINNYGVEVSNLAADFPTLEVLRYSKAGSAALRAINKSNVLWDRGYRKVLPKTINLEFSDGVLVEHNLLFVSRKLDPNFIGILNVSSPFTSTHINQYYMDSMENHLNVIACNLIKNFLAPKDKVVSLVNVYSSLFTSKVNNNDHVDVGFPPTSVVKNSNYIASTLTSNMIKPGSVVPCQRTSFNCSTCTFRSKCWNNMLDFQSIL